MKPFRTALGWLFEILGRDALEIPPKKIVTAMLELNDLHVKHDALIKEYVERYDEDGFNSDTWGTSKGEHS